MEAPGGAVLDIFALPQAECQSLACAMTVNFPIPAANILHSPLGGNFECVNGR